MELEHGTPAGSREIDLLYGELGPTPRQADFRDAKEKYRLFGGAVGGGKTWTISAELIRACLYYPGNRVFMCRHESTAFKNTTLKTLLKLISEIEQLTGSRVMSNHHKTDKTIYFVNGSELLYGALGEAEDVERIKSLEIGAFGIDEASETVEENFQMLKSRLRWRLPDGTYPYFFGVLASNPEPGWVKNTFVTPQQMGEPLPNHIFVQALPSDNPHLPSEYIADLRATQPTAWVNKYLEGSWSSLTGQIYEDFRWDLHVVKPFPIPREWKRLRAIDHGQQNPACCLWMAVDFDGNVWVYREYYSPGLVSRHCAEIRGMSEGEDYMMTTLPPECFGKREVETSNRLWSIADEYMEHGIPVIRANNTVLAGINRVQEYFRVVPDRLHPLTGRPGAPRLFIFENCRNLLMEVEDYTWKRQKGGVEDNRERPVKDHDHAVDALRYGIMTRPSVSQLAENIPWNSFMKVRERYINAHRRAERKRSSPVMEYIRAHSGIGRA